MGRTEQRKRRASAKIPTITPGGNEAARSPDQSRAARSPDQGRAARSPDQSRAARSPGQSRAAQNPVPRVVAAGVVLSRSRRRASRPTALNLILAAVAGDASIASVATKSEHTAGVFPARRNANSIEWRPPHSHLSLKTGSLQ